MLWSAAISLKGSCMHRRFLLVIFAAILVLAPFRVALAEDEAQPDDRSLLKLLPAETMLAIETDRSAIRAMNSLSGTSAALVWLKMSLTPPEEETGVIEAFEAVPVDGRICIGVYMGGNEAVMQIMARINGDPANALAELVESLQPVPTAESINGQEVFTWTPYGRKRFHLGIIGDIMFATSHPTGVVNIKAMSDGIRADSFIITPAYQALPPVENGFVARAAFDIATLAGLLPPFRAVFDGLGLAEAQNATWILNSRNGTLEETIRVNTLSPVDSPAFEFTGGLPIPIENSAIPDTAIAAVRLAVSPAQLWAWVRDSQDTLGPIGSGLERAVTRLLVEKMGIADPIELFSCLDSRLEFFFDHPEGALLPDFVGAWSLHDADGMGQLLDLMGANGGMESVTVGNSLFYMIPAHSMPRDFPWGLALGVHDQKFVVTSNVAVAVDALKRAAAKPLVGEKKWADAMAGLPTRRSIELMIDGRAFTGLFNLLRVVPNRFQRALLPAGPAIANIPGLAIGVGGAERHLGISTRGPMPPVAAFLTVALVDFVKAATPAGALEQRAQNPIEDRKSVV